MSRTRRDCCGWMPGAAPLTSLGFLPLISVESWFHAGLCCHWSRGLITQLFPSWLSRFLQCWFPSNLTPRVSSDLLQGLVWKLHVLYDYLLPLVLCNHRHSSLFQAYLCTHHPYLHLNTSDFSPLLSQVSDVSHPSPAFVFSMVKPSVFHARL